MNVFLFLLFLFKDFVLSAFLSVLRSLLLVVAEQGHSCSLFEGVLIARVSSGVGRVFIIVVRAFPTR